MMQNPSTNATRAFALSTLAFTVCFSVWAIFAIIGVEIKAELGLSKTAFGFLTGLWSSSFMLLFALVVACLVWMSLTVRQLERNAFVARSTGWQRRSTTMKSGRPALTAESAAAYWRASGTTRFRSAASRASGELRTALLEEVRAWRHDGAGAPFPAFKDRRTARLLGRCARQSGEAVRRDRDVVAQFQLEAVSTLLPLSSGDRFDLGPFEG